MTDLNPYQSPTLPAEETSRPRVSVSRTAIALLFLLGSTAAALIYTYVDEAVANTHFGAWPLLFATSFVSIVSAAVSRHLWLAPLACFVATMAGDLLAAYLVSVPYAQIDAAILLSLAFSCPALIVAFLLRAKQKPHVEPNHTCAS